MKLHEYMKLTSLTDAHLGKTLDKDRSTVTKYRLGILTPPIDVISQIDRETNGAVSFRDFVSEKGAAA